MNDEQLQILAQEIAALRRRLESLERLEDPRASGTWTPVLTPTSGSYTHSTQLGRWWRNGRTVHLAGRLTTSGISSPTGTLTIAGLPFTAAAIATGFSWSVVVQDTEVINLSTGFTWWGGVINQAAAVITLREHGDNVTSQGLPAGAIGASSGFSFSGWYIV